MSSSGKRAMADCNREKGKRREQHGTAMGGSAGWAAACPFVLNDFRNRMPATQKKTAIVEDSLAFFGGMCYSKRNAAMEREVGGQAVLGRQAL